MLKRWFTRLLLASLVLSLLILSPAPAQASLREMAEAPGQHLYQSRKSLRDSTGHTWQVVFFKRVKADTVSALHLRLVGFPGVTHFRHPAPLTIKADETVTLAAPDLLGQNNPGENVGEYDFQGLLSQLPANNFWQLQLPLEDLEPTVLNVPYFLIQEWQKVAESPPSAR
ncbi:DUF3122 domain-containing protein [Synechocystis sp. LKSZ1]|uniref:DUF3122 domain-containing protein n=1 Tax=Synechocystis sp. LKSZ1 TaxID=3144951 RepID=UPI00336C205C